MPHQAAPPRPPTGYPRIGWAGGAAGWIDLTGKSSSFSLTRPCYPRHMVHAILGIRPPGERGGGAGRGFPGSHGPSNIGWITGFGEESVNWRSAGRYQKSLLIGLIPGERDVVQRQTRLSDCHRSSDIDTAIGLAGANSDQARSKSTPYPFVEPHFLVEQVLPPARKEFQRRWSPLEASVRRRLCS